MLTIRQAIIGLLLAAELLLYTPRIECSTNFTECYNTTTEMHCFTKIGTGPVIFTEAQKWCSEIDATLLVINNDEVQTLLEMFFQDLNKSEGIDDSISYIWTNANRIVASKWQWLNTSFISGQDDCQNQNGNVLQYGDKCYVAYEDAVTWFDARNRCLKEFGDLASFGDLENSNINFSPWLDIGLSNGRQYWVGARILWWSWKNSDDAEVRYTSWLHGYPVELYGDVECMSVCIDSGIEYQLNGWRAESCTQDQSVGVICHKVTSLDSLTDLTSSSESESLESSTTTSIAPKVRTTPPLPPRTTKLTTLLSQSLFSKRSTPIPVRRYTPNPLR